MTDTPQPAADKPEAPKPEERRKFPRYPFSATAEVVEPWSGTRISGRVSDLCLGGCYIDAASPMEVGKSIRLQIIKDDKQFNALAKVVNAKSGMGMGVMFTAIEPEPTRLLNNWIGVISGTMPALPDEQAQTESSPADSGARMERNLVLNELIILLMRKKVLSDKEGLEMLKNLHS